MHLNTIILVLWLAFTCNAQDVIRKPLPPEPVFIAPKVAVPVNILPQPKSDTQTAAKPTTPKPRKPKTPDTKKLTIKEQIAKLKKTLTKLERDIHSAELKVDRARALRNTK